MEVDKKTDSSIRSDGAEIFVQGYIMLELGYPTALASRNMPGYDILVQNITNKKSCRIQVKYRSAVDSDGFRFKNFDVTSNPKRRHNRQKRTVKRQTKCQPFAK
jgi:hypothetical protein